jgi:hypothetical protein
MHRRAYTPHQNMHRRPAAAHRVQGWPAITVGPLLCRRCAPLHPTMRSKPSHGIDAPHVARRTYLRTQWGSASLATWEKARPKASATSPSCLRVCCLQHEDLHDDLPPRRLSDIPDSDTVSRPDQQHFERLPPRCPTNGCRAGSGLHRVPVSRVLLRCSGCFEGSLQKKK